MDEVQQFNPLAPIDENFSYEAGLFDFVFEAPPGFGVLAYIVLPQITPIPANAQYRILLASGWHNFQTDFDNQLYSATGEAGHCPPPGDSSYSPGLHEGDFCVQLKVSSSANDADGVIDSQFASLGGVAVEADVASEPQKPIEAPKSDGGGGLIHQAMLLVIWMFNLARRRVKWNDKIVFQKSNRNHIN
jgi:hypothetical protein